jgi:hypothetical protein
VGADDRGAPDDDRFVAAADAGSGAGRVPE